MGAPTPLRGREEALEGARRAREGKGPRREQTERLSPHAPEEGSDTRRFDASTWLLDTFLAPAASRRGGRAALSGAEARHAVQAARVRPGDVVRLIDGEGWEAIACVESAAPGAAVVEILDERTRVRSEGVAVTLAQAVLKGPAMSGIVRRAAELGVAEVVPVVSERAVARIPPASEAAKLEHWRSVALAATKQSRGVFLTHVRRIEALPALAARAPLVDLSLVAWEEEGEQTLAAVLSRVPPPSTVMLVVGPEGGLSRAEVDVLAAAGARVVGVGCRVLRADWAGAAIAGMISSALGGLLP